MKNAISNKLLCHQVSELKTKLFSREDLLSTYLGAEFIARTVSDFYPGYRKRIFCPLTTLHIFLYQALSEDGSCRNALSGFIAKLISSNKRSCSYLTGAYCQARQKIPIDFIVKIVKQVAQKSESMMSDSWSWKGHRVYLVDGTTLAAPDTQKNQQEYPQNIMQKVGLGFPIVRVVGVFSLATGSLIDLAFGSYSGKGNGETTLFKKLINIFNSNDVVLFDRYYTGSSVLNHLQKLKINYVGRSYGARRVDFRRGVKNGQKDHTIDLKTEDGLIRVREVEIVVQQPGFRARKMVLVTSFLDKLKYSKRDLADLYLQRWNVELDIRNLKTVMGMDTLRCKTPEMLRKEVWVYMLGYNVIRGLMALGANKIRRPRSFSFKATMQLIRELMPFLKKSKSILQLQKAIEKIGLYVVANRSGRYEPRAIKHRRKADRFLTIPRTEARNYHWYRNRVKVRGIYEQSLN